MKHATDPHDTYFVLFGAGGDLSWRLIVPALFDLHLAGHLPRHFLLPGVVHADHDADTLAARTEHVVFDACRPLWREHLQYPLNW